MSDHVKAQPQMPGSPATPEQESERLGTVPERMKSCPVQGGMAVPVIAGRHRDPSLPALFGINDPEAASKCLHEGLCGACGQPLLEGSNGTYTMLLRPTDFARGYSAEPVLHSDPECATYSLTVCPWLNGRMTTYRRVPRDLEAQKCGDSACNCRRWRTSDDHRARAGQAVPPVFAATYDQRDYRLDWGEVRGHSDVLRGVNIAGVAPLTLCLVRAGEWSVMDLMVGLMVGLPVPESELASMFGLPVNHAK